MRTMGRTPFSGRADDLARISIDGTPSEHDAMRGQPGAFATTVRDLNAIRSAGAPFELAFALTQHNIDSLDFVAHLAARYGARGVRVQPRARPGRAEELLPGELMFARDEAARLTAELGISVRVDA